MNKKKIKYLKILMTIIVVILFIELFYIVYLFFFTKENPIYFDGTNSFIYNSNNKYIAVGSNNDNDKYYEKGKITVYDKDLNKIKEKFYNKGYKSTFLDLVEDNDGYVVVGSYEKTKIDNEHNSRRALIVKYDLEGNVLFEKDFRVTKDSAFTGVICVDDGYVVVGYSISEDDSENGGAYIVKYDKTGNVIWTSNYGDKSNAKFKDIIRIDNYYYVVGINENNISVICKFDSNGKLIKDSYYKYTDNLGFTGIVNYNNNLYITGSRKEKGKEYDGNALIVKYDYDLNKDKEVIYNIDKASRYNTLKVDKDNIIAIGTINVNKQYDGLIGKYDSDLNVIVTEELGSSTDTYFNDLIIVDGKYRVIGYSSYNNNYLTKFITYSDALRVLETK